MVIIEYMIVGIINTYGMNKINMELIQGDCLIENEKIKSGRLI